MGEHGELLAEADEWVRIDLDRNGLVASLATAVRHLEAERDRMRQAFHDAYVLLVHALARCDDDPDVRPQLRRAQQVCSDQIEWIEFGTEATP